MNTRKAPLLGVDGVAARRVAGHSVFPLPLLLLTGLLAVAASGPPAAAQECEACGPRPYICDVEISARQVGDRGRPLDPRRGLVLSGGDAVEIEVEGIDASGREFPRDRSLFVLETGRSCRSGMVEIDDRGDGRFKITPGGSRGECELWLWVPGNMNLQWRIPVEVRAAALDSYSRAQAEHIARSLYLAILGREADREGLGPAVAEIQRGRLGNQIESMIESGEYRTQRAGLGATALLEGIYQGLLGREPDSGGVRRYLREVERGRVASVVMDIVRSEEFEGRMRREGR